MAFHPGEQEIQRRAGVEKMAARVSRMIGDVIPGTFAAFLEEQRILLLGHRNDAGRVTASLVTGRPGFAWADDSRTLEVDGPSFPAGEGAVLAIDFASRNRVRLNGRLEPRPGGFRIHATQVYGNCPKYIQARVIVEERPAVAASGRLGATLTEPQRNLIQGADTFFIATVPPGLPADVSHRGGNPGFVRIDGNRLSWDDYTGNAMFNTLGNVQVDPEVGLLFVDFQDGRLLHVNGKAKVVGDRDRRVEVELNQVADVTNGHPFRWSAPVYSPFNPR